ncbi:MAG: tetratricopeptide repeat protein [Deltaproteobacteria bacterium]|nr:tetratricopeptide repeat protein [Deltaproteobacteria bacterium]
MLRRILPICVYLLSCTAWAQNPPNSAGQITTPMPQNVPLPAQQKPAPLSNKKFKDPYKAFEAGAYDQALQGFVDLQIEKPNDTDLMLSIGAAHYQMNNLEDATQSFQSAAANGTKAVQAEAHYNLGNTYFKEGKLEESVKAYQRALELNPSDEDAKFNIEYVRDEIRRRHEEAKKRQQDQENQQDQKQQEQQQNDKQDPNKQDEQKQKEDGQEGQNQDGQEDAPEQDTDKDGLPDEQEKSAKNPTDPNNPDSDGDGLSDGEEDKNGNGQVDKDETDPNKKDSNGNGVSDGEEAKKAQQEQEANAKKGKQDMSKQDAERLLRNLGPERKPSKRGKKAKGRRAPGGKDW